MVNRKVKVAQNVTAQALPQQGKGIVKGKPEQCLSCLNPMRQGEKWSKHTSRDLDYSVIVHERCNGKG